MKLKDLKEYQLGDVVQFNNDLNPDLWGKDETLKPEVRDTLLQIADDFQEFLGVNGYEIDDITISGSNAAYTYTENSDIDLHLIVDMEKTKRSDIYRELFDAKKYQYNDLHDYRIGSHGIELYVQDASQEHISQGIYSILNDEWVSVPTRRKIEIDDMSVSSKFEDVKNRIEIAINSGNLEHMNRLAKKIGEMRRAGLSKSGEFSPENLAFKILRNTGWLEKLKTARNKAKDKQLSIIEEENHTQAKQDINDFIEFCVNWLGLSTIPSLKVLDSQKWSSRNSTFGKFDVRNNEITVNIGGRHPVDAMRTIAHELVHFAQNQAMPLPPEAGETASRWENNANATAGEIMRDYVDYNPSAFATNLSEASGYIPKNSKEANDPRYSHALTVDIKPGEIQRQAAKLGLSTDISGVPPLLSKKNNKRKTNLKENLQVDVPSDEWLHKKIQKAKEEGRDDFGVPYTGTITAYFSDTVKLPVDLLKKIPGMRGEQKNVRREDLEKIMQVMKDTGKLPLTPSGKEYAPFIQVAWNGEAWVNEGNHRIMAADALGWKYLPVELRYYDGGERVESGTLYPQKLGLNENYLQNADNDDLLEVEMSPSALQTWLNSDKSKGIRVGFEAEIIVPISKSLERNLENDRIPDSIEEVLDFFDGPDMSQDNLVRFEDKLVGDYIEWAKKKHNLPDNYDEDELIDFIDEKVTYEQWFNDESIFLSDIADTYAGIIDWPEYIYGSDTESFLQDLEDALGRSVYSGSRDSDEDSYTIVSDESIATEMNDDEGMEIVSPPLPLQEMLDDLSKLKKFLNSEGAETNASTGLHINISVPDSEKVDYVKLVLFSGDDYVLKQFNRSYNNYASSALRKMTQSFKLQPDVIKQAFDAIKNGLSSVASELLRQDVGDEKYTSIHIQKGYMEVRSPGNDWLAKDTDTLLNTALRYARAMSIASDPDAEKKEYLKKLYKLVDSDNPAESIFAQYAAGKISREDLMKEWARKTLNFDMWDGVGPGETVNYYKVSNGEKTVIIRDKSPYGAETKAVLGGDFDPKDAQNFTIEKIDDEDVPKELEAQKRRDILAKRIIKKLNKLFTYIVKRPDGEYLLSVVSSNSDEAWDKIDAHPLIPANPVVKDQQVKLVSVDPAPDDAHSTDFKVKRRSFFAKILIRLGGVEDTIGPIEVRAPSETRARDRIDRVLGKKVKQKYGENATIQAVDFADSQGNFDF